MKHLPIITTDHLSLGKLYQQIPKGFLLPLGQNKQIHKATTSKPIRIAVHIQLLDDNLKNDKGISWDNH